MKTVRLYGILAKKFGNKFVLDIASPLEAVRALCSVVPGFREFLQTNKDFGYRVLTGRHANELQSIANPVSDKEIIRIVPVITGAGGGGGLSSLIEGALLVTAAIYAPEIMYAFSEATGAGMSAGMISAGMTIGGMVGAIGVSMILGGISKALTAAPNSPAAANPSYIFNGAQNNLAQGNPVPICYGELIIGSQVVSVGVSTI